MKPIKAILSVIAYIAIYLGINFAVSLITVIAMIARPLANAIMSGGVTESYYNSLIQSVYDKLSTTMQNPLSILMSLITLFILVMLMHRRGKKDTDCPTFITNPGALNIWSAVVLGLFFNVLISYAYGIILSSPGLKEAAGEYESASSSIYQGDLIWQIIAVAVCAPILEEFLFRGMIMGKLRSIMPPAAAVILQAGIFAVMHGDPVWMSYAFIAGLLMGWLCMRTRSLFVSMAFHMAFNSASFLLPDISFSNIGFFILLTVCLIECILAITIIYEHNSQPQKKEPIYVNL